MSELKELSWEVQETTEPLPFEAIERRGVRRRRHRQALAGAGVVAAVAIAVLAIVVPFGNLTGTEKPPVATPPKSIASDPAAEELLRGTDAQRRDVAFAGAARWAAPWSSSYAGKPIYTVVLSRDGVRATGPVREMWFSVLRTGNETIALSGPSGDRFSKDDPSWPRAVMVRLTDQGKIEKPLRWAAPTTTFGPNEIITQEVTKNHALLILNPDEGTLRELKIPNTDFPSSPIQDRTGRWWLVGGKYGQASYVFWTDDGARSWNKALLDPRNPGGGVWVSADGNTVVAQALGSSEDDPTASLRRSTDRGRTWTTAGTITRPAIGGPAVFDDGRVLLLKRMTRPLSDLFLAGGGVVGKAPYELDELIGGDGLLYGIARSAPGESNSIYTSTDDGKTWTKFVPR